jgi:ring-1,2-phenylacetyl-CoA epoxidase subunit PaaE
MGIFSLFKTKQTNGKDCFDLEVAAITKLTEEAIQISFLLPDDIKSLFDFQPGQYVELSIELNSKIERRSYSICSGKNENLAIAVKKVPNGIVSSWLNENLTVGTFLQVSTPRGNFILKDEMHHVVGIASGSGITPIISIAKHLSERNMPMELLYGNKNKASIMFSDQLVKLKNLKLTHFLSEEKSEESIFGRINKENLTSYIKSNLSILKVDAFFLCGPEEMIITVKDTLLFFGVSEQKIHFELFTPPKLLNESVEKQKNDFVGDSNVIVAIDGEREQFTLNAKGKTILEAAESEGMDLPYSCRGGVCSSCKAKVIKGLTSMDNNFTLTDKEIEDGYILTCQAHPASEEVIISFNE